MDRLWTPWRYQYITGESGEKSGGNSSPSTSCIFCTLPQDPVTGALTQLPPADLDTEERGIGYKTSEVPISKGGEVEDEAITRK